MNFRIIENILVGKKDQESCEDKFYHNDNFACVVDGATSKSDIKFNNQSQGQIASNLIVEVIKGLDKSTSINEFIEIVNAKFCEFYLEKGMLEHMKENTVDRLSASIAIYNNELKEVWLIGDCQALVNGTLYNPSKKIDLLLGDLRSFYVELELLNQDTKTENLLINDITREKILPLLKKQHIFQNNYLSDTFSYGVIDGFEINKNGINIIKAKSKELVLATDGYPKLFNSLKESESYLKMVLENDPLCYKLHPSTKGLLKGLKSFDDRTYLKLEIN